MYIRSFSITVILTLTGFTLQAQTVPNSAAVAKLETAVNDAKAKVALNEKKITAADSIIDAGKKLIDEAKDEIKSIDAESKKYEKDYASRFKTVKKLTGSKDKTEAKKAATDLRALETEHRNTNRNFELKMNNAYKRQTTGLSTIDKGQKAKFTAKTALDNSNDALKAAQQKYEDATGTGDDKGKGKNK